MPDFEIPVRVTLNNSSIIELGFEENAAEIRAGKDGVPGLLSLFNSSNRGVMAFDAERGIVRVGQEGTAGRIRVVDANGVRTIVLDGATGDIILANADCAEEFDIDARDAIEAGMVMVIGDEERLRSCRDAYDRRVAGVLSGAGDCRPGIILGKRASSDTRLPLALNGKVFCRVDAHFAPVGVGDLLTTSATRGHAMKAIDPARAFGAVIGKALRPLKEGCGLIPVLVGLQ